MRQIVRHKFYFVFGFLGIAALALFATVSNRDRLEVGRPAEGNIHPFSWLVSEPVEGYEPVKSDRNFTFPKDHAAHPRQRTEAWTLSGVLSDANSALLATQITFFRVGLSADQQPRESSWAASEVYAGVVGITNTGSNRLDTAERLSRAAAGLAGARLDPLQIWIEDWRIELENTDSGRLKMSMDVSTKRSDLSLDMTSQLQIVGTDTPELRPASDVPFNVYWQPGLLAEGVIRQDNRMKEVSGRFALEHAWGELPVPSGPVARDRFTIFLDDGRELTLIRSHRADGSGTPRTNGALIFSDGTLQRLTADSLELTPLEYWKEEKTGARYPTHWMLEIPELDIHWRLLPELVEQTGDAWRPIWMAPMRLQDETGYQLGSGIVLLSGYTEVH